MKKIVNCKDLAKVFFILTICRYLQRKLLITNNTCSFSHIGWHIAISALGNHTWWLSLSTPLRALPYFFASFLFPSFFSCWLWTLWVRGCEVLGRVDATRWEPPSSECSMSLRLWACLQGLSQKKSETNSLSFSSRACGTLWGGAL